MLKAMTDAKAIDDNFRGKGNVVCVELRGRGIADIVGTIQINMQHVDP